MKFDDCYHGQSVTCDGPNGPCYGTVKITGTESEPIGCVVWDIGSVLPEPCVIRPVKPMLETLPLAA